jgi:8-oxo-dGTP pyrophosphatase MutT (NUDIX family)
MQLVYSNHPMPQSITKSIFLAGPSPRSLEELDWRHEALAVLRKLGFDGTVFLPVPDYRFERGEFDKNGQHGWHYDDQVEWECEARKMADIILFWVPRVVDRSKNDLGMPAFTTNFEMGEDLHTGKLAYGRPDSAVKCKYLDKRAEEVGETVHNTLDSLMADVTSRLGEGALRIGGEARVPLHIWRHDAFKGWYANLKAAGNRLDDADLKSSILVGNRFLFAFTLWVKVWVEAEQRHKSNEVIISRKDISAVFAACRDGAETKIALVREFRSTVSNPQGYVYELPGGSSFKADMNPSVCAQEELHEETGLLVVDVSRFVPVGRRQLAATVLTHQASLYAVELTPAEFGELEKVAQTGQALGDDDSSERTYVVTTTLKDISALPVDYSTLGMVFEAVEKLGMLHV